MIKFFYNGLKVNGGKLEKFMAWTREATKTSEAGIAIHAKGYQRFSAEVSKEFAVENNTDSQTDYFEQDHFFVPVSHPRYAEIKSAVIDAKEAKFAKRHETKKAKLSAIFVKTGGTLVEEKPSLVKVVVEGVAEIIKGLELKAKGLEVAAEYLRLYGIEADEVASEVSEPTYLDLYEF